MGSVHRFGAVKVNKSRGYMVPRQNVVLESLLWHRGYIYIYMEGCIIYEGSPWHKVGACQGWEVKLLGRSPRASIGLE